MVRPVEVEPLEDYRIRIRYSDGVCGEVDLSDLVGKGVFRAWTDRTFFDKVHVAPHGSIAWSGDIEICSDALYFDLTGKSIDGWEEVARTAATDA